MPNQAMVQQAPAGSDFSALGLGMLLPVTTGLEGWWFPGTDAAKTVANRKAGGAAATLVGAPVYGAGFATFTGLSAYLQTGIIPAASRTIIAVGRRPPAFAWDGTNATKGVLVANLNGTAGSLLYTQSNPAPATGETAGQKAIIADASYWTVSGSNALRNTYANQGVSDFSVFGCFAGVVDDVAKTRAAYDLTRGTSTTASETGNAVAPGASPLRIGSGYSNYAGQVDIAMVAVFSRALAKTEIDACYAFARAYLARRGIVT